MRTMPDRVDFGFLKGAKMEDKFAILTGKAKATRVLPQKGVLNEEIIKYFINQAIEINAIRE